MEENANVAQVEEVGTGTFAARIRDYDIEHGSIRGACQWTTDVCSDV